MLSFDERYPRFNEYRRNKAKILAMSDLEFLEWMESFEQDVHVVIDHECAARLRRMMRNYFPSYEEQAIHAWYWAKELREAMINGVTNALLD